MTSLTIEDALIALARRIIWFGSPEESLANPARFAAYALDCANQECPRCYLSDADN